MPTSHITVSGYHELLALHKALLEAKFHRAPENTYVAGSPHVSRIADEVSEAIVECLRGSGDFKKAEDWENWLSLDNHEWVSDRVAEHMRMTDNWRSWSKDEIRDYIRCMFSPFRSSDEDIENLLLRLND